MSAPRWTDPADTWVYGADGSKYWGKFGAAGTLIVSPQQQILLQLRANWTHSGGTWGIPGGAIHQHEDAMAGSLRELHEEVLMPGTRLTPASTWVVDLGHWSYTTVVLFADFEFAAAPADNESDEVRWVSLERVTDLPLHHGFRQSWPEIRNNLHWQPTLVVPDDAEIPHFTEGILAQKLGLRGDRWFPEITHFRNAIAQPRTCGAPLIWLGQKDSQYHQLAATTSAALIDFPSLRALKE